MTLSTCAEKFEHRGDAWVGPREQAEMQAQPNEPGSITRWDWNEKRHVSVRHAKPPMSWEDRQRIGRSLTPEEEQRMKVRDNLLAIRQLAGLKPRTLKPLGPKALEGLNRVYHPCKEELDPFARDWDAEEARHKAWLEQQRRENAARRK